MSEDKVEGMEGMEGMEGIPKHEGMEGMVTWFATWDANLLAKSQCPERLAEQLHVLTRRLQI